MPSILSLAALLAGSGCSGARDRGSIEIDLTTPITPVELAPDSSARDLAEIDGPADFTVRLPARTIEGRFRSVAVYAPILLDESIPDDDPARSIETLDLRFEVADDSETVLAQIEGVMRDFDIAPDDRAELEAFVERFRTTVAERGGDIVSKDFAEPEAGFFGFTIEETDADDVALVIRFMVDDVVTMMLTVDFDNGLG